jgi:hypothetical protein
MSRHHHDFRAGTRGECDGRGERQRSGADIKGTRFTAGVPARPEGQQETPQHPSIAENVPSTEADVPSMASANVLGAIEIGNNGLNDRQKWIVKQTEAEVRLMRSAIQDHFGVCDKTAKRDLAQLVRKGLIRYVRKPHPGYYVRNA